MARRVPSLGSVSPSRSPNRTCEFPRIRLSIRSLRTAGRAHGCHGAVAHPELGEGSGEEPLAHNDPHKEHDFGSFEIAGRKFFFKLDYYDLAMEFGSEDPADPAKTMRVLTIMLAEEY